MTIKTKAKYKNDFLTNSLTGRGKSYLVYQQIEFPKIHDIVALLDNYCIPVDRFFEEIREDCVLLADFAVLPRYPGEWSFSEEDARKAYKNALFIKDFVNLKMEK